VLAFENLVEADGRLDPEQHREPGAAKVGIDQIRTRRPSAAASRARARLVVDLPSPGTARR
jgi:hypothetical protein